MNTNYRTANVQTVKKVWVLGDGLESGRRLIKLYGSTTAKQREYLENHFDKVYYKKVGRKHITYQNPIIDTFDDDEFTNIYIAYLCNNGYKIYIGDEVYSK